MTDDDTITLSREALRHRLADLYCVALHHEHTGTPECRGTQAADQVISELLAPPPPSLRERVANEVGDIVRNAMPTLSHDAPEWDAEQADAVLAVVADWLAAEQEKPPRSWGMEVTPDFYAGLAAAETIIRGGGSDA